MFWTRAVTWSPRSRDVISSRRSVMPGVLAIAFVVSEILYVAAYLGNADYLRAFVWLIGLFTVLGLFGLAAGA